MVTSHLQHNCNDLNRGTKQNAARISLILVKQNSAQAFIYIFKQQWAFSVFT